MESSYLNDEETLRMREYIDVLNKATKAYDEGHPIMSDKEWDDLYFQLLTEERASGFAFSDSPTQKISYKVVSQLEKVEHDHKMLSLSKTKNFNDIKNFLNGKSYIAMCKMDGLTCSLTYKNGFLTKAETRGDGIIGENILHNALVIQSIPNHIDYLEDLIIDGEIISTYNNFTKFSQEYKNPRNFAAGSIRLLDSKECEKRGLKFVAWEVIKGLDRHISHFNGDKMNEKIWYEYYENENLSEKLKELGKLGFSTAPYYVYRATLDDKSDESVIDYLKAQAELYSYPIDGIVYKFDNIEYGKSLGETAHHFKNAMAYKFYDETYPVIIKDVEWTMGRTGVLTPIALFDPVEIEGAMISRASLHNYGIMVNELHLTHKGQKAEVYRSNMIIPQIDKVYLADGGEEISIPDQCPICGAPTKITNNNGVQTLICSNKDCLGRLINRLDHFIGKKGLDIKGISKATLEKLIDWGWVNSLEDLFTLKQYEVEWIQKPGFGEKSVRKILDAIALGSVCSFTQFISAIGIPLIGTANAKQLNNLVNSSYEDFRDLVDEHWAFFTLPDFGLAKSNAILDFDYTEADKIFANYITIYFTKENNKNILTLKDKVFVITGKLQFYKNRGALIKVIEDHGGRVVSAVSAKTTYLINNDINSTSAKNIAAKQLNIPIITEEELNKML